ncbi:MAG: SpoIIE family protein phosphatase [Candidatus Sumerlaeia bacterium]|nr:SpoIIE family protein phosphatase [Candidatus Sumerlaeia bacterium]
MFEIAISLLVGGTLGGGVCYALFFKKKVTACAEQDQAADAREVTAGAANEILGRRLRRLELLREINHGVARARDFNQVMELFNDLVPKRCKELGLSHIRLLLPDNDGALTSARTIAEGNPSVELLDSEGNKLLKTAAQQVLTDRSSLFLEDVTSNRLLIDGSSDGEQVLQKVFLIPILSKDESLGVLEVSQQKGAPVMDEADQEFFTLVADQLGNIIENARLITEMSEAEKEAREKESKYRLLAENNTDLIWTVDMIGRYTYLSPSVERMLGYTQEQMRSRAALRALTPGPGAILGDEQLRELGVEPRELRKNQRSQMQHQLERADGTKIWVETRATVVKDQEGNPIGFQGVTRDIEERKRGEMALHASQERFSAIFEDAMDAIFILRNDMSISDVNPMGCHLLRRSKDEIMAITFDEAMLVSSKEEFDLTRPEFKDGVRLEALGVTSTGDLVPVEASIALIETEEEELYLAIVRDISERREASRRQKVMDRRMRGIVDAADELLTSGSQDQIYRQAVELARNRLGLGTCAIFVREGRKIRGTWGIDDEGNAIDRRKQVFEATEDWLELFRPQGKSSTRAVYTTLAIPGETHGALCFPSAEWSIVSQVRNDSNQPVALLVAEAPSHEGREAEDLAEVVAIFCSLLGGIIERRLIEDAIKESEERARRAYQAKQREMDKIAEVHSRLLPSRFEATAGLAFTAQCRPSADVGGDFYLVLPLQDGRVAIAIADVSGHGAKAAVATATSRALIYTALREIKPEEGPSIILSRVSSWLQDQLDVEQFVTVWLGFWDPGTEELVYASCAHHPAVLARPSCELCYLPQDTGLPVGISGVIPDPPPQQSTKLEVGDRIMLYTDGWVESPSTAGETLDGKRFLEFVADAEGQPLEQLTLFLFTQFEHFVANTSISDDVTFLAFDRVE